MTTLNSISIKDILAAQKRIAGLAIRTPLIPFNKIDTPARIFLKLENLQPIGSFKLRGAANAIELAGKKKIAQGIYTASMGKNGPIRKDEVIQEADGRYLNESVQKIFRNYLKKTVA